MNAFFIWCSDQPWLIVILFAILQGIFLCLTICRMLRLNRFFDGQDSLSADDETKPGISLIKYGKKVSEDFKSLIDSINDYIQRSGMADFSIIKDKTERIIESKYDNATAYISYPTLLGLLGTFFGVVCGLVAFNSGLGQQDAIVDENVSQLIHGVIISMATSVIGLVMMMAAQGFATCKKKKTEAKRDEFYNFLQMQLLPANSKDTASAIGKLSRTVGSFIRKFQECTDSFSTTFSENTDKFSTAFSNGATAVKDTVEQLHSTATGIGENISKQGEIVERQAEILRQMQSEELSGTLASFVSAANSFTTATSAIQQFDNSKEDIINATSALVQKQQEYLSSLEVPREIAERLTNIFDRVRTFEESLNRLGTDISQSSLIGNTEMNIIEAELAAINHRSSLATSYQQTADEDLQRFYEGQISRLQSLMGRFDQTLSNYSTEFEKMMQQATNDMRNRKEAFEQVINESFDVSGATDELKCLRDLPEIKSELTAMRESLAAAQKELKNSISAATTGIEGIETAVSSLKRTNSSESRGTGGARKKQHWWNLFKRKGDA